MVTELVILGLATIVAAVAIVAIVFGRGFKGHVGPDQMSVEVGNGESPKQKAPP